MNAGTLKGKVCRSCGEMFRRGVDNVINTDYCNQCHVVGWQQEMHEAGCSVAHPKQMGKAVRLTKIKVNECPKLIIDGVSYRDVTDMLYEESKYRKRYLSNEDMQLIERRERKRREMEREERLIRIEKEEKMVKREEIEATLLAKKKARIKAKRKKDELEKAEMARMGIVVKEERKLEDEVLEALNGGFTKKEIYKMLKTNEYYVNKAMASLEKKGKIVRRKIVIFKPDEDKKIVEMKKAGAKHKDIAKEIGRTESSVGNRVNTLKEAGRL